MTSMSCPPSSEVNGMERPLISRDSDTRVTTVYPLRPPYPPSPAESSSSSSPPLP
eukprot:CAMPEP_0171003482 /NCGR_PEP_ID=MMETSP0736-20130129/16911_1 /TAXON_ID=186038 /ORGANISM="Fragilariopsis kerguelensis, Strain L26-C5" /LENGTH=54 /DNA_ID=CAMNT_0011432231 /DNA_START=133 /DNA_END=297 /DNA_ORIENTATION=-